MTFATVRETIANLIYPEQRVERRNLDRLANVDALTGLANRRAFELALPAAEADPGTAIVLFDANNFGKLNKKAGHKFGDILLKEMADCIVRHARVVGSAARAFRIGGDEFVVLAETDRAGLLRDIVERSFGIRYPGVEVSITGTVGDTFNDADAIIQERKGNRKNGTKN